MRYRLRIYVGDSQEYILEASADDLSMLESIGRWVTLAGNEDEPNALKEVYHEWAHMPDTSCGGRWVRFHPTTN